MAKVIKTTFRLKRATEAQWLEVNPILALAEPGFVQDKNQLKIGDGVTPWKELPFIEGAEAESILVTANTKNEFPAVGNADILYRARSEKQLYQWNSETMEYEVLVGSGLSTDEVLILYGGSASDMVEVL